jgi:acyl dehydratase
LTGRKLFIYRARVMTEFKALTYEGLQVGEATVRARSIHTDEAWARAKGFKATLAQGMMSTAYVSEMMTCFLGAGFVKGGTMSMAFVKPVYAGDRLTVHGVVKDKRVEGAATRVVVDVRCVNQDGETTAVGTASGLV